jgi:HEPN domain-containing protein
MQEAQRGGSPKLSAISATEDKEKQHVESQGFDVERVTEFWLIEAEEALRVADHLMEKADYSYALFFGHLAVEKVLKSLYVSLAREHAPPIHNLVRLSNAVGLELDDAHKEALITITAFNIEGRYPDLKRSFRLRCTRAYSEEQIAVIKEVYEWLRSQTT